MIIAKLFGGLGNQMFQYAAGAALAHRHGTILKLDVSKFSRRLERVRHERYALACFNIQEHFATEAEILKYKTLRQRAHPVFRPGRFLVKTLRNARLSEFVERMAPPVAYFEERSHRYDPDFLQLPMHSYVTGHWQSEKFFGEISDLLRAQFTFRYPPAAAVRGVLAQIEASRAVSIHFRRGDYVDNPEFQTIFGSTPMDYYHHAVKILREKIGEFTLYVFSDDLDFVRNNFQPDLTRVYVDVSTPNTAYEDMRLMSSCQHHIMSASTFSWWASWLNPHPGKVVIVPTPWFDQSSRDGTDIVPDAWIQLARR